MKDTLGYLSFFVYLMTKRIEQGQNHTENAETAELFALQNEVAATAEENVATMTKEAVENIAEQVINTPPLTAPNPMAPAAPTLTATVNALPGDPEAAKVIQDFTGTWKGLRSEIIDGLNATVLSGILTRTQNAKQRFETSKDALPKDISESMTRELEKILGMYTTLEFEITNRQSIESKTSSATEKIKQIRQIDREAETKKDGTKKYSKEKKKEREQLVNDTKALYDDIQGTVHQIRGYVDQTNVVLPRVSPELLDFMASEGIVYEVNKNLDDYKNNPDLKRIPELKDKLFGTKAISNRTARRTERNALTPAERNYLIEYQKIAWNSRVNQKTSRAESLTDLAELNQEFNNKSMGTVRNFRMLAKEMKDLKNQEKKKAGYTEKMLTDLFDWAYYEALNKQGLKLMEVMQANNRGIDQMQPTPNMLGWDALEQLMSPPGDLYKAMEDMLIMAGFTGDLHPRIMKALEKSKYYKEGLKGVDLDAIRKTSTGFQRHPYIFGSNMKPSDIHRSSGSLNSAAYVLQKEGVWELQGDFTPQVAFDSWLAMSSKDTQGLPPNVDKEQQKPILAYKLLKHWVSGDIDVVAELKKIKNPTEARQMGEELLKAAMRYEDNIIYSIKDVYTSDADIYFSVMQQKTGVNQGDRDISNIPEGHKKELFSRAAVTGLINHFRLGHEKSLSVQNSLSSLFCEDGAGAWNAHPVVNGSNKFVGDNMIRLVDEVKNKVGFATSPKGLFDIFDLKNLKETIVQKGATGYIGEFVGDMLKQIPGVSDASAHRLGSFASLAAKGAVLFFGVKMIWDYVSGGKSARQTTKRIGIALLVGGAFGKDIFSLLYGGKGGLGAEIVEGLWNNKEKLNNPNAIGSKDLLHAIFGHMELKKLAEMIEVDNNKFVLKQSVLGDVAKSTDETGQANLTALMSGGSVENVNAMIHHGLGQIGITPSNFSEKLISNGSSKISDLLNTGARVGQVEKLITEAFGYDLDDAEKKALEDKFSHMSTPDQQNYMKKLSDLSGYGGVVGGVQVMMMHLLKHRSGDLANPAIGLTSGDITMLQTKFDAKGTQDVKTKILTYLSDPAQTIDTLKTDIEAFYGNNPFVSELLATNTKDAMMKSLDAKITGIVVDFEGKTGWHVNNPATPGAQVSEYCFKNLGGTSEPVFVGVDNGALSMRVKNKQGVYVQWLLDSVGTPAGGPLAKLTMTSFGYTGADFEVGGTIGGTPITKTDYSDKMIETVVRSIVNDPETKGGTLDQTAYTTSKLVTPVQFAVSKTPNTRP